MDNRDFLIKHLLINPYNGRFTVNEKTSCLFEKIFPFTMKETDKKDRCYSVAKYTLLIANVSLSPAESKLF